MTDKRKKKYKNIINYAVFMGPSVVLFVVIGLIPFFYEIWYSFTDWDGIHKDYSFVGLTNYIQVVTNDLKYWHSMWFTMKFAVCVLIFSNFLGFSWAYGLSRKIPFRNVYAPDFIFPGLSVVLSWDFSGDSLSQNCFRLSER